MGGAHWWVVGLGFTDVSRAGEKMIRRYRAWLYVQATAATIVLYAGPGSIVAAAPFTWTGTGNPPDTWDTTVANWTDGSPTAWVNNVDRSTPNTATFSTG